MTAPLATTVGPGRVRYLFLDSLRGLAAMYVLIFHSLTIDVPVSDEELSTAMRLMKSWFGYGHFAVATFIVLSGFSLMLPLARGGEARLSGGFFSYMRRRCRRIFPPYYAALALSIVAVLGASLVPGSSSEAREQALSPGSIVSHFGLFHNLNSEWVYRINGPMWSVATEFQIYLLFPILLLPLWERFGARLTILVAWGVALSVHFLLPDDYNLSWAAPWFIGSFLIGMWTAVTATSPADLDIRPRTIRWGWVSAVTFGLLVAIVARTGTSWSLPILDAVVSVASATLILACVQRHNSAGRETSTLLRVLSLRSLVVLGSFSYSLYLLQHPLLRLSESLLATSTLGYEMMLWVQLLVGTPIIMFSAWIFAQFFEIPFTSGNRISVVFDQRRKSSGATLAVAPSDVQ